MFLVYPSIHLKLLADSAWWFGILLYGSDWRHFGPWLMSLWRLLWPYNVGTLGHLSQGQNLWTSRSQDLRCQNCHSLPAYPFLNNGNLEVTRMVTWRIGYAVFCSGRDLLLWLLNIWIWYCRETWENYNLCGPLAVNMHLYLCLLKFYSKKAEEHCSSALSWK